MNATLLAERPVVGKLKPAEEAGISTPMTAFGVFSSPVGAGIFEPAEQAGIQTPVPTGFGESCRSAFCRDSRPCCAFDWRKGQLDYTFDGLTYNVFGRIGSIEEFLALPIMQGTRYKIVCESTFESHGDQERRHQVIKMIRDAGHELYVFRPLATSRYRIKHDIPKTHIDDARVIFKIAMEAPTHVYPAIDDPDTDWYARSARLNAQYRLIRDDEMKNAILAKPAEEILGKFKDLSDEDKAMFGNKPMEKYIPTMIAAVYFAAISTPNRRDFERLLGMHGSGHPCLLRSEIFKHSWNSFKSRGGTLTEFRRAIRVMRSRILAGIDRPDGETTTAIVYPPTK